MENNPQPSEKRSHSLSIRKRIGEASKRSWTDPQRRKRTSHSLNTRQRMSEAQKRRWADPECRKRAGEASKRTWTDPEVRKARIEGIRKAEADPKLRKRRSEASKRMWINPEYRRRISDAQKRICADPEVRQRRGEAQRRSWMDPQRRKRGCEAAMDPQRRKRISEGNKRHWATNSTRRLVKSAQSKRMWADFRFKLAAAWRPLDWWDKPTDYRILATELMGMDGMTNRELAERLDRSRILKCPYAATWKDALSTRGFLLLVNNVRKWIKRQGGRKRAIA